MNLTNSNQLVPRNCRPDQGTYPVGTTANPENPTLQMSYADRNCDGDYNAGDMVILSHQDRSGQLTEVDAHGTSRMLNVIGDRRSPDINGDGTATCQEANEAKRMSPFVDRFDRSSDGRLSGNELTYRPSGITGLPKVFRRERFALGNDFNNDGKFSRTERARGARITSLSPNTIQIQSRPRGVNPFADRPLRARD